MMVSKKACLVVVLLGSIMPISARDILLEFKAAYFLPTHTIFKKVYHGGALFGPELTVQLCDTAKWYGFFSIDYLRAHGHSLGLCTPTKVQLVPLAFGAKYFMPSCFECLDCYAGLGFEAMNVRTQDCAASVQNHISKWGFGGIAKLGAYYYLPRNFFLDIFIDYQFLKAGRNRCFIECGVQECKANINGVIFGAALGYHF